MSLASKPLKTGVFPAGAPTLRGEAPSRPLPRLAGHEPRVVLRLPDCSPSVPPAAEPLARAAAREDGSHRDPSGARPLAMLMQILSKPRMLLACLVGASVMLAVVIFVSRSGRKTIEPAHDEPTRAAARGEVSPPIPRTPGAGTSTFDGRRSSPEANHSLDIRSPAPSGAKSASTPVPNHATSLAPETLSGPRGLPYRTLPAPAAPERRRDAQGPWASLLHEIH
jgi:hypothetical protein